MSLPTFNVDALAAAAAGPSLSRPSKMPGPGWSLQAIKNCKTGAKLAKVPGSICSKCYAKRGNYPRPNVKAIQARRLAEYHAQGERWPAVMAVRIMATGTGWFRWFDAGDLISAEMLERILTVCRLTPSVKHWLPTQENGFLDEVQRRYSWQDWPENLIVRLSTPMIDEPPPEWWPWTSTTYTGQPHGYACPASSQGNKCVTCRACWDRYIPSISYPKC
jgi:hypothetical protein